MVGVVAKLSPAGIATATSIPRDPHGSEIVGRAVGEAAG